MALELVALVGQGLEIGDAVPAGAGGERRVLAGEREQRGVTAGGAAADAHAPRIAPSLLREPASGGETILDVDLPPATVQEATVAAAVPDGSAVVDLHHREPPGRPVLDAELQRRERGPRGAAVADHQQWRQLVFGSCVLGTDWGIEERVGGAPRLRRELDGLRYGDPPPVDAECGEVTWSSEHVDARDRVTVAKLDLKHLILGGGRPRDRHDRPFAEGADHGHVRAGNVEVAHAAVGEPYGQAIDALAHAREHDPAIGQVRVARAAEHPLGHPDVHLELDHGRDPRTTRGPPIEVPPAASVADERQRSIRLPARLRHRLSLAAGDQDVISARQLAGEEASAVPGHVRVVPLDPAQPLAVGAEARAGGEVRPAHHDLRSAGVEGVEPDYLVANVGRSLTAGRMTFANAHDRRAIGTYVAVGVALATRHLGRRGERPARPGVWLEAIQALIVGGAEPDDAVAHPPGATAVLVYRGARAPALGQELAGRAVRGAAHELDAATLVRTALGPDHRRAVDPDLREANRRCHEEL